ncbi:prepilin-type N-terminal cleavage/methylation domain-containing protein [Thiorhodococcus minor]|uniref:Prepilin-type N-terminal cleavage/methylation domain-containing protein n=1 Tax=Thiorhodococcus minor TaxID=57489 RepID=A0A6M0K435_9GAMM|nr:prepilin-type N-terminal cleavage/methylation domain-containing protein [Thiorhodococcus minor]NEV64024.1 prepilin-type N-terminal cleavage/methylation domain-containing protein [Thiorhodococcus minor]
MPKTYPHSIEPTRPPAAVLGRRPPRTQHAGVTLIELLLSLAIVGILTTVAMVSYGFVRERQDIVQATVDIQNIEGLLERYFVGHNGYPDSLADIPSAAALRDPWGNPYRYLNIATVNGNGQVRKDHNLVPLNTDYDLYSMGKDGRSVSPLTAQASRDDIVRANNGGFIGLAADY